jgi:hypothetical protein
VASGEKGTWAHEMTRLPCFKLRQTRRGISPEATYNNSPRINGQTFYDTQSSAFLFLLWPFPTFLFILFFLSL